MAALRPRQWTKNFFVFAALLLTGQLGVPRETLLTVATFVIFCAVSSAIYLVNDLADVEQDRQHPTKRFRPLAAGEISPAMAGVVAVVLAVAGLAGGFAIRPLLGGVVGAYLVLQLAYTFALKHMVIVEVLVIAGGFVLRVLAGGAAIDEPISPYLYLSTAFLAVFQGFAKRRHELAVLAGSAGHHRQSLSEYSLPLLDQLILLAATATVVTYSLYAIETPHLPAGVSANMLLLTIPFVLYAVFRYLYLVHEKAEGGAPEEILLTDRLLLLDVFAWGLVLVLILYVLPQRG